MGGWGAPFVSLCFLYFVVVAVVVFGFLLFLFSLLSLFAACHEALILFDCSFVSALGERIAVCGVEMGYTYI